MKPRIPRIVATLFALAGTVALGPVVHAQEPAALESQRGLDQMGSSNTQGALADQNPYENNGYRVGESSILRARVVAQAGYDTNVFYQNANPVASALVNVIPSLMLSNRGRDGSDTTLRYELTTSLAYRQYLTDNAQAKELTAFTPSVTGVLNYVSSQRLRLQFVESFMRALDAPYGLGSTNITRDVNTLSAGVVWSPGGGRIDFSFVYNNRLVYFENQNYKYGSNLTNELVFDVAWKWLPKTAVFLEALVGHVYYLDPTLSTTVSSQPRANNIPIKVTAGLRGLLTPKLAVLLGAGYTTRIFEGSVTGGPSGLANIAAVAELSYLVNSFASTTIGYRRELQNSAVLANYLAVDSFYLNIRHRLGSRTVFGLFGDYSLRAYRGDATASATPFTRDDTNIRAGGLVDVFLLRWLYLGASYTFTFNDSNLGTSANANIAGLDYQKHYVLGRLGLSF